MTLESDILECHRISISSNVKKKKQEVDSRNRTRVEKRIFVVFEESWIRTICL